MSVLLRNAMFIFTPMNPAGSILGSRHRFRVRPRSPLRPIRCYNSCEPVLPFIIVYTTAKLLTRGVLSVQDAQKHFFSKISNLIHHSLYPERNLLGLVSPHAQ